jgi:hypothetical protein
MPIKDKTWVAVTLAILIASFANAQELMPQQPPSITTGGTPSASMNPDVSAIIDAVGGYWQRRPLSLAGDDPDLGGTLKTPGGGMTIQEAEVAFQSNIDPYWHGDLFLTIPNQGNLEVEEGFLTTTALPADLQLKAGIFRAGLGRQNAQHLHLQDFVMRPLINQTFLGVDGLRAPGVELSWLTPLPFYSMLMIEAMSPPVAETPTDGLQTFGGGTGKNDLAVVAAWKNFFDLSESTSAYLGLNFAAGQTSQVADPATGLALAANMRSELYGADLYVKYKPANESSGYFSVAWQSEYFQRWLKGNDFYQQEYDGGVYTQLVFQLARRWFWGVRFDALGLPSSDFVRQQQRYSTSLTFVPSEFSKIRLYGMNDVLNQNDFYNTATPLSGTAVMLQFEASMGAHGAHPF